MFRKIRSFVFVVGVLNVLALPGPADASWEEHLDPLRKDVVFGIAGIVKLESDLGGAECRITTRARIEAGTSTGQAETLVPQTTDGATRCKGLGAYALCQMHDLLPRSPRWPFRVAVVHTEELTLRDGRRAIVRNSYAHQGVMLRTKGASARFTGVFCPGKAVGLAPGAVGIVPEGGPNTIATMRVNGVLVAHTQAGTGKTRSATTTVSGKLEIENPAQRDLYSIALP